MTKFRKDKIVLAIGGPNRIKVGPINHLPLSLLSIAAWLREKGDYSQRIKIVDTQIQEPDFSVFEDAAVVGISAMTGIQIKYGLKLAALARKSNPDAVIVWGGIHPSLLPVQTAEHPLVDLVVIGEGEQTFLEVVSAIFKGDELAGIPGTCIKKNNGEIVFGSKRPFLNLDDLPIPAYDLIDIRNYHGIEYQFDYQSSRGCPFKCGFCYNTTFCSRRWRKKSPEKVIRELDYLYNKYKVINFAFVDDEFFLDIKRTEAIFDGILEKEFSITASCRLDIIRRFSPSLMKKIKQSGVTRIFFGAESGSNKILRAIQKKINTEDIIEGSKMAAEHGIRPVLSFMSGFPGETLDDFEHTIDIIMKLWLIHPLVTINGIFPFNPYPGTVLYQKAMELGLKPPSSLEEWGDWIFQYEPDSPWLDPVMKQWMEIAFYMVRFIYYIARYEDRYKGTFRIYLLKALTWPLSALVKIRMKKRIFAMAFEWKIFALIMRKTFGYL